MPGQQKAERSRSSSQEPAAVPVASRAFVKSGRFLYDDGGARFGHNFGVLKLVPP